jgi:uncharacterized protein (DUF433 family)
MQTPGERGSGKTDDSLVALTDQAAARLAHVTIRQLRYWEEIGLLRPGVSAPLSLRKTIRLYGFDELVALLVISQLRDQFSLQLLRKVVDHLRSRGYERPLSELHFAVAGDEIFFQHPEGSWEGSRQPDQIVLEHVLHLEPLKTRIRRHVETGRDPSLAGKVERRRGVMGSKPVFAGTRIPVSALFPYLQSDQSVEEILDAFPQLREADVQAAREAWSTSGAA